MSFIANCVGDSLPVWQKCLETPFLRQLGEGSLDERCFAGYLVDDSLYLREYAKVFAWGMLKAEDMAAIRVYHSLLSFVNESEDATRLLYLERYGLRDGDIQRLPLRPENAAYTQCMLDAARQGSGAPQCMMAALPCMLSYVWIFRRLLERYPGVRETVFWPLVRDYVSDGYEAVCREWAAYGDTVCDGLPASELEACAALFRKCSEHELNFWHMSERPRADVTIRIG